MMPHRLLILIGLMVLLSCKKDDGIPTGTPVCVQDLIAQMQKDPVRNPAGSVSQYTYKGQTVYYVPPTCCDQFSILMDASCQTICAPDGGFTGIGDGRCSDFFKVAKDEKVIWQDPRR